MMTILLAAALGYVIGAAPVIYLLARQRGLDLRAIGTGNIGAGNLWRHAGPGLGLLAVVVEIGKGVLAPVAARFLGLDLPAEVAAAVAAVAGQMWPATLGFQGGRGNGTGGGALLALSPLLFLGAFALFLIVASPKVVSFIRQGERRTSKRSSTVPIAVPVGMAAYGAAAFVLGQPAISVGAFAIVALVFLRRATAPWPPDPANGQPLKKSWLSVLLLDRPRFKTD